ncbi:diguanylate cyclase domain-containing protein [Sphingomonas sp. RS2018]
MRQRDNLPVQGSTPIDELLAQVLGTASDPEFDALTGALARLTGCGMAFLSLTHKDQLWFKSSSNGPLAAMAIERSFCSATLRRGALTIIADAASDPAYADHPLVRAEPFIRFYAGVPLRIRGQIVGTVCVVDQESRDDGEALVPDLRGLGGVVETLIEARLAAAEAGDDAARLMAALAARNRLHSQLQQAERMAEIGSWRLTVADGALEYSEHVYAIHDLEPGQPRALEDALRFYPEPDRQVIAAAVKRAIDEGRPYDLELDFVTATGRKRRVRAMAEPECVAGNVVALVGVFQDVTDRHRQQQALEHQANTDPLTELGGRRGFTAALDAILQPGATSGEVALVLVDLDHFKLANDRYGHPAGDQVLQRVAAALNAPWLADSYAARLGGDEFALVVTDPALLSDLDALAGRLLRELVVPVGTGAEAIQVTATLGLCHGLVRDASRRALLECADAALYHAKRERRGTAAIRRIGAAAVRRA